MNKLHTLALIFLFGSIAFAQNGSNKSFENKKTELSYYSDVDKVISTPPQQNKKAVGDTIWSEDFTNGFPAGWSVYDSTGNNYNWVINNGDIENITANPPGYTNAAALASESGGNHMLLFADEYNRVQLANTGTAVDMNAYFQTSGITLNGQTAITVHFQQRHRVLCLPPYQTNLWVSTDPSFTSNVSTYDIQGGIPGCTQSPNPMDMSINISDIAADYHGDIYLRFYIESGISHYFWMIDDIYVTENGLNDITTHQRLSGSDLPTEYYGFGGYQYTRVPVSQIQSIDFQMIAKNTGSVDQPNTNLTVDINDGNASIFNNSSISTTLSSFSKDTFELNNFWTPPTSPLNIPYTITIDVFSDSIDESPWNNQASFQPFEITSGLLALDDFSSTPGNGGGYWGPNNTTEYEAGNHFSIINQDEMLYSIDVVTGTNTPIGTLVNAVLYEIDFSTAPDTYTEIWRSPSYSIQASDVGTVHHFNDSPGTPIATLTNGKTYFAGIHCLVDYEYATSGTNPTYGIPSEIHSTIRYPNMANPMPNGSYDRIFNTPMIRLNFDNTVGLNINTNNNPLTISPNPTSGKFTISINSKEINTLSITNTIGQEILSKTINTIGKIEEEISLEGHDKGIYFITLKSKTGTQTSKLILE
tara:strand:- start:103 stop:2034 length:1932 start_codon:yes stop_codon:yes gene_type:complete